MFFTSRTPLLGSSLKAVVDSGRGGGVVPQGQKDHDHVL